MHTRVTLRLATLAIFGFAILGIATTGEAGPIALQTPAGLTPGETFRFVFVTDDTTEATSTNIATYDAFVQADAGGATYNGAVVAWQAIGSTSSVSAITHIGTNPGIQGVYLPDGTLVTHSDGSGGLWSGSLTNAPEETINGTHIYTEVWTGTLFYGSVASANALGSYTPMYGDSDTPHQAWVASVYNNQATNPRNIYGISAVLTVPTAVPEPSTGILAGIGSAIALVLAAFRKR